MTGISREYAEGLFLLCAEQGAEEAAYQDLETVQALFQAFPDYVELLSSPSIPAEERSQAAEDAFSGRVRDEVVCFLRLLTERDTSAVLMKFSRSIGSFLRTRAIHPQPM